MRTIQVELEQKGFFLNTRIASDLLTKASQVKTRDVAVAGIVWDMCQKRGGHRLPTGYYMGYYRALVASGTPRDDRRMIEVRSLLEGTRFKSTVSPEAAAKPSPASASEILGQDQETSNESSEEVSAAGEEPQGQSEDASETGTLGVVQQ
ncbi:hypothetical protein R1sor_000669 [Riccia sorocarpa]|uniref:Uncharacterized protein n=1 Tax=Riccia sorocarpa TaxID=122646 RepID=A0ABD3GW51_9MARC